MAHFAEIDPDPDTGTVLQVVVVHNDITTIDGVEVEQRGIDFLDDLYPDSGNWVQTSYSTRAGAHKEDGTPLRYNYAGKGSTWDEANGAFYRPQPYPSWSLDENFVWQPPSPMPTDTVHYWDEDTTSWVEIE